MEELTKLIFLDVDGVMNHEVWYKYGRGVMSDIKDYESSNFDPFCVELLNGLTDATGAKIVASSSWRLGRSVAELSELFSKVGITGEVIGKTRFLNYAGIEQHKSVPRGCEIQMYLYENELYYHKNLRYVIFDDDADMLIEQQPFFLQTDSYSGITPNLAQRAREILGVLK